MSKTSVQQNYNIHVQADLENEGGEVEKEESKKDQPVKEESKIIKQEKEESEKFESDKDFDTKSPNFKEYEEKSPTFPIVKMNSKDSDFSSTPKILQNISPSKKQRSRFANLNKLEISTEEKPKKRLRMNSIDPRVRLKQGFHLCNNFRKAMRIL